MVIDFRLSGPAPVGSCGVVELWDLHYSCVHCSPSIVGGLDNALRLDQLSIIDGGNKLTVYHQTSSWACVSVSKFIKLVVGGRFVAASCQLPETRESRPTSPEGLLCTTISCKGFARGQSSFRIVRWIA